MQNAKWARRDIMYLDNDIRSNAGRADGCNGGGGDRPVYLTAVSAMAGLVKGPYRLPNRNGKFKREMSSFVRVLDLECVVDSGCNAYSNQGPNQGSHPRKHEIVL